jgi:imidazoleglycerol phosphate dehydratase HisB
VSDILSRKADIVRKTKETDIKIHLNIDGEGSAKIDTGLKFFDHMLDQIARHAKFDLELDCKGDLQIDEHHTIEDVAICLGEAYKKALGDKKGISRFSSERIVPLDEAISFVSVDISGRPFCSFDAKFEREYCGDLPTEMIPHFFQSFAISAGITLHIKIEGKNTHHKIESCFKSFAKCLYDASRVSGNSIVSTKGLL